MRSVLLMFGLLFATIFLFSGCAHNQVKEPESKVLGKAKEFVNLDEVIVDLANQLGQSSTIREILPNEIAVTAFVSLNQLNKTSQFGRVLGESFYNELFVRGFNVLDFRGQNAISVNASGEFFITRDINKLSKEVKNSYVLVGTYAPFGKGVVINARVIDNSDGKVVASARSIYVTPYLCEIFESCSNNASQQQTIPASKATIKPKTIKITTDNCTTKSCPK